jgi:hypothetical protein
MRIVLDIDDDLIVHARSLAARSGRTLSAVVDDALRTFLAPEARSAMAAPFFWPTFDLGPPLPGVDLANSAALLDIMDEDDPASPEHEA